MRLHYFWLIFAFLGFCSCDKDDSVQPNPKAQQAFESKYPYATKAEWEKKNNYLTVDFIDEQQNKEAWFDADGQWYMTKTELTSPTQLPDAVRQALANSEYAQWYIDDIDRLERYQEETVYVIEVKKGQVEYDLFYSSDGILIKSQIDQEDDYETYLPDASVLPDAIRQFIEAQYPDSRIIETEREHGQIEVEIIHNNRGKEIVFNSSHQWLNTHYDVRRTEVEEVVLTALQNSIYATYQIDDIERYETPTGNYYLFELEKGNQEIDLKIDPTGQLL